jgi:HNH endonuclease
MATLEINTASSSPQAVTSKQLLGWFWQWCHPLRPRRKTPAERRMIFHARRALFERSGGLCEMRVSPKCEQFVTWRTMHTHHLVARARGGSRDLDNLLAGCGECHTGWKHNGGKPCSPKPKRVRL